MKIKLLRKVREVAADVFDTKCIVFQTCNGKVERLKYACGYEYAFDWMFGERLDYYKDHEKIVGKIARLMWRDHLRDYWRSKIRSKEKGRV